MTLSISLQKSLEAHYMSGTATTRGSILVDGTGKNDASSGSDLSLNSGYLGEYSLNGDGNTATFSSQAMNTAIGNKEFTITLWWKQSSHTDSERWSDLINWHDGNTTRRLERGYADDNTNDADWWCNLGNTSNISQSLAPPSANEWFHITVRVSSEQDDFSVWINGEMQESKSTGTNDATPTGSISVNDSDTGSSLEDIRFYTRGISDQEIRRIANIRTPPHARI